LPGRANGLGGEINRTLAVGANLPVGRAHSETLKTGHARRCRSDAYSDGGSNPPASIRRVPIDRDLLTCGEPVEPWQAKKSKQANASNALSKRAL